ncbi:MAG TPA: hypothetical protein VHV53_04700 [Solirubrobacterales bacterium]|jgi:hypothetical protein|nr:hypothetical protein [Solirubrobacterales bacterium]
MKKSDWLIALTLALCTVGVVACGGGSASGDEQASREEAQLEFTECMREHGVDVPDPKPGQRGIMLGAVKGGPGGAGKSTSGINPEDPATKEALKACESKLPDLGAEMSPEQEEQFKEAALAFSECMRDHGVDVPDPQFTGKGKVTMKIGGGKGGIDPNSPAFQEAQEACRSKLPDGGKGGPVGAAPAP